MNRYCYCIIKDFNNDINEINVGGATLTLVKYKELSAVLEEIESDETIPSGEELLRHDKTLQLIMDEYQLIPMSYGSIFESDEDIIDFLKKNYEKLSTFLNKFKNKFEVNLRIFWTTEAFKNEIEDSEIQNLKNEVLDTDNQSELLLAEIGKVVEQKVETARQNYINEIINKLSKIADESKLNSANYPRMILNSAFLLDKSKEDDFDKLLNELLQGYTDKLIIKYTGPWPPYNFIEEKFSV